MLTHLRTSVGWLRRYISDYCNNRCYSSVYTAGPYVECFNLVNSRYTAKFYQDREVPQPATLDAYVTDVSSSWSRSGVSTKGYYGQWDSTLNPNWIDYAVASRQSPTVTYSDYGNGLYHITGIIGQQQSVDFSGHIGGRDIDSTMSLAPEGIWHITDDESMGATRPYYWKRAAHAVATIGRHLRDN